MAKVKNLKEIIKKASIPKADKAKKKTVYLIANGDLRDSANQAGWPDQEKMEKAIKKAVEKRGYKIKRAHKFDNKLKHGFISSQKTGNDVISSIPQNATIIVAESVWEYSHHILGALVGRYDLKILTVANYSGTAPGLVGLSNLNASLLKHNRKFSTVWSEDFTDKAFNDRLNEFFSKGKITYKKNHIHPYSSIKSKINKKYADALKAGEAFAKKLLSKRAIAGYLDEMCMGMENGVFDNKLLYPIGIGKENISQSELLARMETVSDNEGKAVIDWLRNKGMIFVTGTDEKNDLTERQLIEQGKMYIAAVRIANKYGVDVIGIQYQQGLKDCCAASDLAEGLLNNPERPPVIGDEKGKPYYGVEIKPGEAIPCFNEVDGGCAVDLILSSPLWKAFKEDPSANQEDIRWSRKYTGKIQTTKGKMNISDTEIWVELLSGSSPASHFEKGYAGAYSERQPAMYFPKGGGTLKGVGKPGEVVVSRVYIDKNGKLSINLMRGGICGLPEKETRDRWQKTTPQWPIKHLIRYGISRDNMILHPSNHETILYARSAEIANQLLFAKAAMADYLGLKVYIWGDYRLESSLEYRKKARS
jgi:L-fucose isomerase-like protein